MTTTGAVRYVALLRGVNVGGNRKVAMPQLRDVVAGLGYDDVATYINSGNVVFTATRGRPDEHSAAIAEVLAADLGLSTTVIIRSASQLRAVVEANPYPEGDPRRVLVVFLDRELTEEQQRSARERAAALAAPSEQVTVCSEVVYVHMPNGIGRSQLGAKLDTGAAIGTARNLRTTAALATKTAG